MFSMVMTSCASTVQTAGIVRPESNPELLCCIMTQVVNEDGTLAWSPVVMHPSFHPDLPPILYLRLTTAAGQVRLQHVCHCDCSIVHMRIRQPNGVGI